MTIIRLSFSCHFVNSIFACLVIVPSKPLVILFYIHNCNEISIKDQNKHREKLFIPCVNTSCQNWLQTILSYIFILKAAVPIDVTEICGKCKQTYMPLNIIDGPKIHSTP